MKKKIMYQIWRRFENITYPVFDFTHSILLGKSIKTLCKLLTK